MCKRKPRNPSRRIGSYVRGSLRRRNKVAGGPRSRVVCSSPTKMESRKVRRKSSQVTLLTALMQFRERVALRCLQTAEWLWHLCLVLNPYSLWRSDDFWARCIMWYCALKSRLSAKAAERLRILDWVRSKVTRVRPPHNFTSDWRDGVLLCALLEALVPGSCPRFDLLNPENAASNAQMAMKLIERHLGLKPSMSAEELVECGPGSERKLMVLIAQLKLAAAKSMLRRTVALPIIQGPDDNKDTFFNSNQECVAKGMGLTLAVKGRKATFNIYLKSTTNLNIVIEIRGPGNSICSERITNRSPKRKTPIKASVVAAMCFTDRNSKLVRSNSILSNLGDGNDVELQAVKIPFEYEVMCGKVSVGFIPVNTGKHRLSIIWQGQHILGSPYIVTVDESSDNMLDVKPKPPKRGLAPFKRLGSQELLGTSPHGLAVPSYLQSEVMGSITTLEESSPQILNEPPVLEIPAKPNSPKQIRKLGGVTRRKVLRHIVQVDGKDLVIEESSPEQFALAVAALRKTDADFSQRGLNRQFSTDIKKNPDNDYSHSFVRANESLSFVVARKAAEVDKNRKISFDLPRKNPPTPDTVSRRKSDTPTYSIEPEHHNVKSNYCIERDNSVDTNTDISMSVSSGLNSEDWPAPRAPLILEDSNCGEKEDTLVMESSQPSQEFPKDISEKKSKSQDVGKIVESIWGIRSDQKLDKKDQSSLDLPDANLQTAGEIVPSSDDDICSDEWLVVSVDEAQNSSIKLSNHPVSHSDVSHNQYSNSLVFEQVQSPENYSSLNSDIDPNDECCDSFPSVDNRKLFFESISEESNLTIPSPLLSPARSVNNKRSARTTPVRSYSDISNVSTTPRNTVANASQVFSTSYRSQSLGSLSGSEEAEGVSSSFLKVKEFWERGNSQDGEKLVQIKEQEAPKEDPVSTNVKAENSVREKMNFWQTLTESPAKEKRACYALTSKDQTNTRCSSENSPPAKSHPEEPDGPRYDSGYTTVSPKIDLPKTPRGYKVSSRGLASPGSEGTTDSGIFLQNPVSIAKDRRPRSNSAPCPHKQETSGPHLRSSGSLGTPLTLIYRNNPLFSLDISQGHFELLDENSTTDTSVAELTDDRGYIDDEIPDYASLLMDKYVSFTGLLENDRCLSRRELLSFDFCPKLKAEQAMSFQDTMFESETSPLFPRANKCRAYGAGIYYGQVGLKNHFQVRTRDAGKGCLTISVQGPGQHDVNEVILAYTGDHTYEVMYDVAEPGYYIISVKWSEWNIPESPFICKVTF